MTTLGVFAKSLAIERPFWAIADIRYQISTASHTVLSQGKPFAKQQIPDTIQRKGNLQKQCGPNAVRRIYIKYSSITHVFNYLLNLELYTPIVTTIKTFNKNCLKIEKSSKSNPWAHVVQKKLNSMMSSVGQISNTIPAQKAK